MPGTTLVRKFLYGVGETLQDVAPQYTRWTERELVYYTNFAQRALAKYLPPVGSRVDSIKLAAGTRQDLSLVLAANIKPGDGSTPADTYGMAFLEAIRSMGTDGLTAGRIVREVDRRAKDGNDPTWHTRTAAEPREVMFDKNLPLTFYVSPPAGASQWLEVSWMAEPQRVPEGGAPGSEIYAHEGGSTAVLGIRDQFVDDAHNYVVAVALLKGSKNVVNLPKSQYHANLFLASINAQAAAFTGTNPNIKTLPFIDAIGARA